MPTSSSAGVQVPFLRLFQCNKPVLHKLDYCDIVNNLLSVLLLVFNKTDTLVLSEEMLQKYQQADELLQQLVIRELCADIGKVAHKLLLRQLVRINSSMKNTESQLTKE
jgi:hypothetical protein